jgi:hypothetical protein
MIAQIKAADPDRGRIGRLIKLTIGAAFWEETSAVRSAERTRRKISAVKR